MYDETTDEQILQAHDKATKVVAEAVFELANKFPALPPISIFEGALKGAVAVMVGKQGDSLSDIADLLEDVADILRSGEGEAWPTVN